MTAKELGKLLELSGTGKEKLKVCLDYVKANQDASADDLIEHLHEANIAEGTLEKAEAIAEGRYHWPPELLDAAKAIDPSAQSGTAAAPPLNWDAVPDEEIPEPEHEETGRGRKKWKKAKKAKAHE